VNPAPNPAASPDRPDRAPGPVPPLPALGFLPPAVVRGIAGYAETVAALCGGRLESLCLFGAALTRDWQPGRPIHQVMVLTQDDLDLIGRLGALAPGAVKLGLAAPLLVSSALIRTSLDTFPLEWLEIATSHALLLGRDPFQGLAFAREHVRLQCERECAVLCISLRQRLLRGAAGIDLPLTDLAEHALRVLGGMLYLAHQRCPAAPGAIVEEAGRLVGGDLAPVMRAWRGETGRELLIAMHRLLSALEQRCDQA
jgi:hypothetical protein